MEGFTTIEMRFELMQVENGVLVRMVGKCDGEYNEMALKLGERKVDYSADRCRATRNWKVAGDKPEQFYREYVFSCQESVERFYQMLADES